MAVIKEPYVDPMAGRNWNLCIIDMTGKLFSCKKKDDAIDVPLLCKLILTRSRQGATLSMVLFDCAITQSMWLPMYERNTKKFKRAIEDATYYHKAYGQRLLIDMVNGAAGATYNPQLAKLMMVSFYDIKEEYDAPVTNKKAKGATDYKVTTTMVKEAVVKGNG